MEAHELDVGLGTVVTLQTAPGAFQGAERREASLFQVGSEIVLKVGSCDAAVRAAKRQDAIELDRMWRVGNPQVAWVTRCFSGKAEDEVEVEVREFAYAIRQSDPVCVAVDELARERIARTLRRDVTMAECVGWLGEEFVISGDGEARSVLLGPAQASLGDGFAVCGREYLVSVSRDSAGRRMITKLSRKRIDKNASRAVLLVAPVCFVDASMSAAQATIRDQLDEIVKSADSYLNIWNEYNALERRVIRRRAYETGVFAYDCARQLPNGEWRFTLRDATDHAEGRVAALVRDQRVDLEAAAEAPRFFERREQETGGAESDEDWADAWEQEPGLFSGACVRADGGNVDVRPWDVERNTRPPERGFLYPSLQGDETRLGRRRRAWAKIASASSALPQVAMYIEGQFPTTRRVEKRRLSPPAEALECFGGKPTAKQLEALKVAFHTPDVALIQGPPGTGKTKVIAALCRWLANAGETERPPCVLLSSFQHDAVENAVSATEVFGLPAQKVGRRRYSTDELDNVDRWRRELAEAIGSDLSESGAAPLRQSLRRLTAWVQGYLRSPASDSEGAELIERVLGEVGAELPGDLRERAEALRVRLSRSANAPRGGDDDRLARALRGIRVERAAFADDGPVKARVALERLRSVVDLPERDRDLLERAGGWQDGDRMEFLDELRTMRDCYLTALAESETMIGTPVINADVEALLNEVAATVEEKARTSPCGVEDALEEFRDSLVNDPEGARDAVREYTTVLAATCQQAVSRHMLESVDAPEIAFPNVIVDEAARANPLDLMIPLSLATRRIILVGDHRQLPHVLEPEIEQQLTRAVADDTRDAMQKSLFGRLWAHLGEVEKHDGVRRRIRLDVQFRMHPVLGQFVSDTFYEQKYGEGFCSGRPAADFAMDVSGYGEKVAAFIDVPAARGRESGHPSRRRDPEARVVMEEARRLMAEHPDLSIGVISFYAAQVEALARAGMQYDVVEADEEHGWRIADAWRETRRDGEIVERLRIGTVDAFQGKEFDIVLLSMTRSNQQDGARNPRMKYGHLMLENRLCVAMSRQRRMLIVVGDAEMLESPGAATAVPALVSFAALCKGEHGVIVRK